MGAAAPGSPNPPPHRACWAPQAGARGGTHRPVVPVVAAFQHHLRPPAQTGHSAEEAVGAGQLQVFHGAEQAVGAGPEAPVGGGLHVRVWHLEAGAGGSVLPLRPPPPPPRSATHQANHEQGRCGKADNEQLHCSAQLPQPPPHLGPPEAGSSCSQPCSGGSTASPAHLPAGTYLQRALSSSQVREATPSHMVGGVTTFSHWENWWKVKAVGGSGCEDGWSGPAPRAQLALTGSGAHGVLLPVHLQAEVVHRAVGQQPGDGQLQEQGRQAQQGFGPGCRAGQPWSAGNGVEGQLGVARAEATWGVGRKGTRG